METREVGIFKQINRRGGILSVKVQSRIAFYGHDFELSISNYWKPNARVFCCRQLQLAERQIITHTLIRLELSTDRIFHGRFSFKVLNAKAK
jgi:hypothetical protein